MIEPLKYLDVISVVEELKTEGHCPLHVITNDYNHYYIKNTRDRKPDYNILNEFLCHYFLTLWQIPTPEIAAITLLPERVPEDLSSAHKRLYYNTITFGSKVMDDSSEFNKFFEPHKKSELKRIDNAETIVKIGLFDIWVENTDRKPSNSNILVVNKGKNLKLLAIDHAFTFDSLAYKDLYPGISNTFDQSILYTEFAQSVIEAKINSDHWIESLKEYFYICIKYCQQNFEVIVNNIPEQLGFSKDLQTDLNKFLFDDKRNKEVFEEFVARLKV